MSKTEIFVENDSDWELAQKVGKRWIHYERLRERAKDLVNKVGEDIMNSYICQHDAGKMTRRDIYYMENINQMLCVLWANTQHRGDKSAIDEIGQLIKEDRENNDNLRKEFGNDK